LQQLREFSRGALSGWQQTTIGQSVEGRPLQLCAVGTGATKVLLWSQMHGDEPTHTAVLLQLLHFLAAPSVPAVARRIMDACTLSMIPMLNPDGAERWTRRNAQDIDVNRDARHRQTPEGRALWAAVEQIQPAFGFNLHNQNRRTAVAGSGRAAAVSLLVPPVDMIGTETAATSAARHVASVFCRAVRELCPGMVSRYAVDYMARAFGEAIQQTGCRTVLVEAGDWPDHSPNDLVQLHLIGLVHALHAIADNSYASVPVSFYDSLPPCSEHLLHDMKLVDATIHTGTMPPFRADLAVNFTSQREEKFPPGGGLFAELGDLHVSAGLTEYDVRSGVCAAGGFLFDPTMTPDRLPDIGQCERLLSQGITQILGCVRINDKQQVMELSRLRDRRLPIHFGFLGAVEDASNSASSWSVACALGHDVLALLDDSISPDLRSAASALNLPCVPSNVLPQRLPRQSVGWDQWSKWTSGIASLLNLPGIGSVARDNRADLLSFAPAATDAIDFSRLERVFVGGTLAWEHGTICNTNPGRLLRRAQ
jgi:hypothetical protein